MNTRKKKIAAAKTGGQYFTAAAGVSEAVFEIINAFVRIPAFVKWPVTAFLALIAGCIGCNQELADEEKPRPRTPEASKSNIFPTESGTQDESKSPYKETKQQAHPMRFFTREETFNERQIDRLENEIRELEREFEFKEREFGGKHYEQHNKRVHSVSLRR